MNIFTFSDQVSFSMDIAWSDHCDVHLDHYHVHRMNCWRDLEPGSFLFSALEQAEQTENGTVTCRTDPGELLAPYDPAKVITLSKSRLKPASVFNTLVPGRFYPQGLITRLSGVFRGNTTPFRCLEKHSRTFVADLNHPLARFPLTITLKDITRDVPEKAERVGSCMDWIPLALSGPGLQAGFSRWPDCFLTSRAFDRKDSSSDEIFYQSDRFVHHIDDQARQILSNWYRSLLSPGGKLLDLMAAWTSHLPGDLNFSEVHGLGMNAKELRANQRLTGFSVQDLNQEPVLAFLDHCFDAAVCSLSVEYLIDPVRVLTETARVVKPGGRVAISFSNRWFPEKNIRIWEDLHEFERLGLVLSWFRASGAFDQLSTHSFRGYPRPVDDRYFPQLRQSDPVFGVTGIVNK
ncbi:MAG: methyltransferase domain-containing protein [Desulfotignum sp.]